MLSYDTLLCYNLCIYTYIYVYNIHYNTYHVHPHILPLPTSQQVHFQTCWASQRYQVVDLATYTTVIVGYAESAGYEAENPGKNPCRFFVGWLGCRVSEVNWCHSDL